MIDGLTPRALEFLTMRGRKFLRSATDLLRHSDESAEAVVLSHEREFGGISFPVLGGELEGWIRLGVKSGKIWLSSAGEQVFNFAEPEFVQCGLLCRVDGYFGVSWSREFLPWHASVRHLIEASAVWGDLTGWRKSALCDGDPAAVLNAVNDLSRDDFASSRETSWWMGGDVAIYLEPHLTYIPKNSFRIHVLASSSESDRRVKKSLGRIGQSRADLSVRLLDDIVPSPSECPFC